MWYDELLKDNNTLPPEPNYQNISFLNRKERRKILSKERKDNKKRNDNFVNGWELLAQ